MSDLTLLSIPAALSAILWIGLLGLKGFAFGDAIFRPAESFQAADKQTKNFWLLILGIALLVHLLPMTGNPIGLFNIVSTVVAAVYVAGVRPAVKEFGGGPRRGGRKDGPYGPW